jgi:hypothetical protein
MLVPCTDVDYRPKPMKKRKLVLELTDERNALNHATIINSLDLPTTDCYTNRKHCQVLQYAGSSYQKAKRSADQQIFCLLFQKDNRCGKKLEKGGTRCQHLNGSEKRR